MSAGEQDGDVRQAERERREEGRRTVRYPIFTRWVLVWMLVFALVGVAFGASGAFWWANFDSQVSDLRRDTSDFEERSLEAQSQIEGLSDSALAEIEEALSPLRGFLSEAQMLQLAETYAPAIAVISTLDEQGRPSVGTAFAVISEAESTFYVTSFDVVRAATVQPGPAVTARVGGQELPVELWNWDAGRDLALVRAPAGGVEVLEWATEGPSAGAVGTRVFPVSGVGGAGAALTAGMVIDLSAAGLQHTAPVGAAFRGGPVVDVEGRVVAIASLAYQPLGYDPGPQIHFALPISSICDGLISCGGARSAPPRG